MNDQKILTFTKSVSTIKESGVYDWSVELKSIPEGYKIQNINVATCTEYIWSSARATSPSYDILTLTVFLTK